MMDAMSSTFAWLRPSATDGGTRRYLAGAFVGALIVLGGTIALGWPLGLLVTGQATDPASVAASAVPGECLMWTESDAGDLHEVDCDQPHVFEVTGSADLSSGYPTGTPFPDTQTWQKVTQQDCGASVKSYLGKLDPNGRFVVGALKPTDTQWAAGNRGLHCGVEIATLTGLVSFTGPAKGADQSNVFPVGTCLGLVDGSAGGPVDCGNPHAYEIVGIVNLHDRFPNGYPSTDDQQNALASLCTPLASSYTGGANLTSFGLTLTWETLSQDSWNVGSYRVNCEVGQLAPSGQALAPVTNSIRGIGGGAGSASPSGAAVSSAGGG